VVVEASRAKGAIKKMLLGDGGSAQVMMGDITRMLSHSFLDRPLQRLPWPLSLFQSHDIRYTIHKGDNLLEERTFRKGQIGDAVRLFLEGLDLAHEVVILPEFDKADKVSFLNAFTKLVNALAIPLGLLSGFGWIVAGVWLAILGEWSLLAYGIGALPFSGFALGIAMMPGMLLGGPAAAFHEKGNRFGYYVFGFLSTLYTVSVLMLWCIGVLYFFGKQANDDSIIPVLLWSYGIATVPIAWLAHKDDNEYAMITAFFADIAYVLVIVTILFAKPSLLDVLVLFGAIMFFGLVIQFRIASEMEKQKAVYD
jgi:hypothetical protein